MASQNKTTEALSTFLNCLTALQECRYTSKLLPTLLKLADLYRSLGQLNKSQELLEACSVMEAVLEDAFEKILASKKSRRSKAVAEQQCDCDQLFLQKADELESLAHDLTKIDTHHQAIEHAQNAFRIRQYVLGLQNPSTEKSLRELMHLYAQTGRSAHNLPVSPEKILFTSEIPFAISAMHSQGGNLNIPPADMCCSAHHCTTTHTVTTNCTEMTWNLNSCLEDTNEEVASSPNNNLNTNCRKMNSNLSSCSEETHKEEELNLNNSSEDIHKEVTPNLNNSLISTNLSSCSEDTHNEVETNLLLSSCSEDAHCHKELEPNNSLDFQSFSVPHVCEGTNKSSVCGLLFLISITAAAVISLYLNNY